MQKTIYLSLVLTLIINSCSLTAQNSLYNKDKTATFVFYNVENLFDIYDDPIKNDDEYTPEGTKKWNEERYVRKLSKISYVLCRINLNELPEIIGLAEVENKTVLKDLVNTKSLIKGNYGIIHEESPDRRGIDVALLYNKNEFNELEHKAIPVYMKSNPNFKTRHILYVKGILSKTDTVHIFVNHWSSRIGGSKKTEHKRIIVAKILRNKINKIFNKNKNAKIIVMGDLNDTPQNKSVYKVLLATGNYKNQQFDELTNLLLNKSINGLGTVNYRGKWYMLDNMIVSKTLITGKGYTITTDGGQVYNNPRILHYNKKADYYIPNQTFGKHSRYYGGYSDHLPVYFMLSR